MATGFRAWHMAIDVTRRKECAGIVRRAEAAAHDKRRDSTGAHAVESSRAICTECGEPWHMFYWHLMATGFRAWHKECAGIVRRAEAAAHDKRRDSTGAQAVESSRERLRPFFLWRFFMDWCRYVRNWREVERAYANWFVAGLPPQTVRGTNGRPFTLRVRDERRVRCIKMWAFDAWRNHCQLDDLMDVQCADDVQCAEATAQDPNAGAQAVESSRAICTECGEPWLRPIQNFGRLQFRCLDCRRGPADIVGGPAEVASDMMDTDEPALPSPAQGDAQPGGFLRRVRCTRSGCDDEACDEAMHDMATSGDD
jgi:hypothetical protein